ESSGKKIFLITSTKRLEGKTTVIQALAATLLLSNKRVLIIDTNFSNTDLTKIFNAKLSLEKMDVTEPVRFDQVPEMVSHTQYKGLDILGSAGGNYTPAEVLGRNNIIEHLSELADYYDYILLEGASMNDYSDSFELTRYVESVV